MRVVIAEDLVLLREGLSRLLVEAGCDVVAATGDAETFLRAVDAQRPDVVVVDVRMPPTFTDEGLRAALVVRRQWPAVSVLVLSQYVEERYATELLTEHRGGVGYLLKDRVADVASSSTRCAGSPAAAACSTRRSSPSFWPAAAAPWPRSPLASSGCSG